MSEIELKQPSPDYEKAIESYKQAFLNTKSSMAGTGNLRDCETALDWIEELKQMENSLTCPEDKVPSSTYLAIRKTDDALVGIIDLRHHINHPILSVWGGHIGYSVHPKERRKGYGKAMLGEVLEIAKTRGLNKVLVTCDEDNVASLRTIKSQGGVFEKNVSTDHGLVSRFWISIKKA
ncbi:MAG: GNAT family N-acetyltransferase [Bacillota bacterium]